MNIYLALFLVLTILLILGYIFLVIVEHRIKILEKTLLQTFFSRTDMFPALFEVSRPFVSKHTHIFGESMNLRKQEFHMRSISSDIEAFKELESHIHHEINFIFRVCNQNPKLLKNKQFLYLRDIIMDKSLEISKNIKKYNKIILIYNKIISIKNYSIIGYILPFTKKRTL